MAACSDDSVDFTLSTKFSRFCGRFKSRIIVGGRGERQNRHGEIRYLDRKESEKTITTSAVCSNSDFYSVCLSDKKLIISGGYHCGKGKSMADIHQFNFESKKWKELNPMPRPRDSHNSVSIRQTLLILGGCYREPFKTVKHYCEEVYALDLRKHTWTTKRDLPIKVMHASAAVVESDIFLFGGSAGRMSVRTYRFSLQTNEWSQCSDMPPTREYGTSTVVGRKILYLVFTDFLVYDVHVDQWSTLAKPIVPSRWSTLLHENDSVLVMGGLEKDGDKVHKRIQCYDLREKEWSVLSDTLPIPLSHLTAIAL